MGCFLKGRLASGAAALVFGHIRVSRLMSQAFGLTGLAI